MIDEEALAIARRRYVSLILWRAGGVVAMVVGIVIWKSDLVRTGGAPRAGLLIFVAGFVASLAVPQWLARRWRSPRGR